MPATLLSDHQVLPTPIGVLLTSANVVLLITGAVQLARQSRRPPAWQDIAKQIEGTRYSFVDRRWTVILGTLSSV